LRSFSDHPLVGEARGVGLMGAAELVADKGTKRPFDPAKKVGLHCATRAEEHGLIVRALVDSVAFCPPLIITEPEIDEMFNRFSRALDETEDWVRQNGLREAD
jgi:4-aminobutyrate--pyruvate transaminase